MTKGINKYYIFMIIIYLFIFEFVLMQYVSFAKYWDELYAVLFVPLFIIYFNGKIKVGSDNARIFCLLILFIIIGIIPNIMFKYQVMSAVLSDILLNLKFFMGIYTTYYLFKNFDYVSYKGRIKRHLQFIVIILFLLVIIDEIVGYFPCYEYRYGLRSEQLFFGHPTGLASVSFFLVIMLMLFYTPNTKDFYFVTLAVILVASTLRIKAIGMVIIFIYLYVRVCIRQKKVSVRNVLLMLPVLIYIGWEQIYNYFLSEMVYESARGALFYKSFEIMKDFFPFGTGLATYASAPSGEYYSPVYYMYELSDIWGLSKDWPAFVSDSFWPMIFAQTGILGTVIYVLILFFVVKNIQKSYRIDKRIYIAGVGAFAYLLVSSTAESAFVNPLSLPLSFVIGIVYIEVERHNKRKRKKDEI